jgi:hypothetical protein
MDDKVGEFIKRVYGCCDSLAFKNTALFPPDSFSADELTSMSEAQERGLIEVVDYCTLTGIETAITVLPAGQAAIGYVLRPGKVRVWRRLLQALFPVATS